MNFKLLTSKEMSNAGLALGVLLLISLFSQIAFAQKPTTIYLAGDSTMAQKTADKRPETGWGEMLGKFFQAGAVNIVNEAQNGRSSKSFIAEGRWQAIVDRLQKGDYVFIQFGHNDESKDKGERYAPPAEFRANLTRFVAEVRAKQAFPVLLTPVMRRRFNEQGEFYDTHGEYPDLTRGVAADTQTPLIDMHRLSEKTLKQFGVDSSKKLFLQLKPDENPNYPKGVEDNTHFNAYGAEVMASLAVEGLRAVHSPLARLLDKQTDEVFRDRLLPAPLDGGFRMEGYWVWCGSVIKGEDGKYHMFASRWPKTTGFGPYWLTNSEIVHAVSDTPAGPYQFSEVALPPRGPQFWDGQMTHNPAIRKYGKTYLLYYTGTTYPDPRPGPDNLITEESEKKLYAHQRERIGLATSASPYGPWKRLDKPILDTRPNSWEQYLVSNAAPLVLKNGKVMLYYKGVEKLRTHAIGLAIADKPEGPYRRASDQPLNLGIGAEDPFVWQEKGLFHALMLDHDYKYSNKEIFYATSKDGLRWDIAANPVAVFKNVLWADGQYRRMNSAERPHVLIENGKPTHVFFATGETKNGQRFTWNMVIPLQTEK